MNLFGWVPPRYSLTKERDGLLRYQDDPDERMRYHIQEVASKWFRNRLAKMDAEIAELRGMMARHKIVDERKPETEQRTFFGGGQTITVPVVVKDRRGRKT